MEGSEWEVFFLEAIDDRKAIMYILFHSLPSLWTAAAFFYSFSSVYSFSQ